MGTDNSVPLSSLLRCYVQGFKPTSGTIERVKFQSTSSVWGYFSVGANGGIHEYADSQFGHLFASGATREAARKNLVLALKEIEVGRLAAWIDGRRATGDILLGRVELSVASIKPCLWHHCRVRVLRECGFQWAGSVDPMALVIGSSDRRLSWMHPSFR